MKTLAWTLAVAAGLVWAGNASAQSYHYHGNGYGGYNNYGGYNSYNGYNSGYSGGYTTGYRPSYSYGSNYYGNSGYTYRQPVWHDTSHYDYVPTTIVPHGNHYHVQPGGYYLHNTGHYHY